jgi:hypothetical protein
MKSVKENMMICAIALTLLLVANVQKAEGVCCRPNGGTNIFNVQISGGEEDICYFIQCTLSDLRLL